MIDVSVQMNDRKVRPDQIGKELEKTVRESVKRDFLDRVEKQTRGIGDPETDALLRFRITK